MLPIFKIEGANVFSDKFGSKFTVNDDNKEQLKIKNFYLRVTSKYYSSL